MHIFYVVFAWLEVTAANLTNCQCAVVTMVERDARGVGHDGAASSAFVKHSLKRLGAPMRNRLRQAMIGHRE